MPEIKTTSFRNIKFTRDTVVDYQTGNPLINCIFKQFDTNGDAKFDDEEWANYQKYEEKVKERREKIEKFKLENNKIISYYQKKLAKIQAKQEELNKKLEDLTNPNYFEELLEFEKNHPSISRDGYTNAEEIPDGAMKYDISAFEMGIYNNEKECFEETYKTGYLAGLETLTEEEKQEYLSLLDKASNMIREVQKIAKEFEKLGKEEEKFLAMVDMAENGMIEKIGSSEYEENMYQQYQQIRAESNPFYQQIKETEAMYNTLARKGNRTEEENKLLEQYQIQLTNLRIASAQWSISDNTDEASIENSGGFQITDFSNKGTYTKTGNQHKITDLHTLGAMYSNENWNVMANFTKEERYTIEPEKEFENSYSAFLNGTYSRNNFSASSMTNFSSDNSSMNILEELSAKYKHWGAKVSENVLRVKQEDETITTTSTTAGISYQAGKFTNNADVTFAEEGTSYSLNSQASFNLRPFKNANLTLSPTASTKYNSNLKTTSVNPGLTANFRYNHKNLKTRLDVSENWTRTLQSGSAPVDNNNFNLTGSASIKGFSTNLKFSDIDTQYSHSNTYGAEISYTHSNIGKFSGEYSYQKSKSKMPGASGTETNMVNFSYTAPLETINKWFKKKSH